MGALDVWGLDDSAETVYRALLRNPELSRLELARRLDLTPATVSRALGRLRSTGLLVGEGQRLTPTPPSTALTALLHEDLRELEQRRARLDAVRAALAGFAADAMVGQSRAWASTPFEMISAQESFAGVEELLRGTTGEVVSCHPALNVDVDSPTYVGLVSRQLRNGRRMRGLYPAEVLQDEHRLDYVRRWASAGEVVRLSAQRLPTIAVFGADVALVAAGATDDDGGARLIVRAPALVDLVAELFEQFWADAVPLHEPGGSGPDADRRRILDLLVSGAKDESIARQLGLSLRTVRRRIAEVMAELGARTRFQAGVEAHRRGLL